MVNAKQLKTLLRLLLAMIGLLLLVYAIVATRAIWDFRGQRVTIRAAFNAPLTEKQAIDLSREALHCLGKDRNSFVPRAYNGKDICARNSQSAYEGYVLWVATSGSPGFSVRLEQLESEVRCAASRGK